MLTVLRIKKPGHSAIPATRLATPPSSATRIDIMGTAILRSIAPSIVQTPTASTTLTAATQSHPATSTILALASFKMMILGPVMIRAIRHIKTSIRKHRTTLLKV